MGKCSIRSVVGIACDKPNRKIMRIHYGKRCRFCMPTDYFNYMRSLANLILMLCGAYVAPCQTSAASQRILLYIIRWHFARNDIFAIELELQREKATYSHFCIDRMAFGHNKLCFRPKIFYKIEICFVAADFQLCNIPIFECCVERSHAFQCSNGQMGEC